MQSSAYTGQERRREPRRPAFDQINVLWRDGAAGFHSIPGRLADEAKLGCGVTVPELPAERSEVCVERLGQRRWAQVRFARWESGALRVGLEYEAEPLRFLD